MQTCLVSFCTLPSLKQVLTYHVPTVSWLPNLLWSGDGVRVSSDDGLEHATHRSQNFMTCWHHLLYSLYELPSCIESLGVWLFLPLWHQVSPSLDGIFAIGCPHIYRKVLGCLSYTLSPTGSPQGGITNIWVSRGFCRDACWPHLTPHSVYRNIFLTVSIDLIYYFINNY